MHDADFDFLGQSYWRKRIHQLKLEFKADSTRTPQWRLSQPLIYGSQHPAHPTEAKPNPKPLQTALKPDPSRQIQIG